MCKPFEWFSVEAFPLWVVGTIGACMLLFMVASMVEHHVKYERVVG
jgi:hypothetical protein